jgi:hypothetical protein
MELTEDENAISDDLLGNEALGADNTMRGTKRTMSPHREPLSYTEDENGVMTVYIDCDEIPGIRTHSYTIPKRRRRNAPAATGSVGLMSEQINIDLTADEVENENSDATTDTIIENNDCLQVFPCDICYFNYETPNPCEYCCKAKICGECFRKIMTDGQRKCPFCQKPNFGLIGAFEEDDSSEDTDDTEQVHYEEAQDMDHYVANVFVPWEASDSDDSLGIFDSDSSDTEVTLGEEDTDSTSDFISHIVSDSDYSDTDDSEVQVTEVEVTEAEETEVDDIFD